MVATFFNRQIHRSAYSRSSIWCTEKKYSRDESSHISFSRRELMILTFLPNPSLDKVSIVPELYRDRASYAKQAHWYAGGKGFHFGRALRQLGEPPLVIAPL